MNEVHDLDRDDKCDATFADFEKIVFHLGTIRGPGGCFVEILFCVKERWEWITLRMGQGK